MTGLGREPTKAVACRSQIVSSARLTSVMASSWAYAPLLVSGPRPREGVNLGVPATLSDIGQTVAANFSVAIAHGESLLPQIV